MNRALNEPKAVYAVDGTIQYHFLPDGRYRQFKIGTFLGVFADTDSQDTAVNAVPYGSDDMPMGIKEVSASQNEEWQQEMEFSV